MSSDYAERRVSEAARLSDALQTDVGNSHLEHTGGVDVLFVVVPFADVRRPAIGVSLLQATATAHGYSSRIDYLNFTFADYLSRNVYRAISSGIRPQYLVGEWIFAHDVFGDALPPADEYVEQVLRPHLAPEVIDRVIHARSETTAYLDDCVARISEHSPRVVGFTTTFHQTCASLALARRLKEQSDPPLVAFGGANCEGEMGHQMLQSFPWIDAVSTGEADHSFPRLLAVLLDGASGPVDGMLIRGQPLGGPRAAAGPVQDLDALPLPDYDDYFRQVEESAGGRDAKAHLLVEMSRGCWWGAKHHCTFCGLNGNTMAFRSKSPERAFREVTFLSERYGTGRIEGVDNILDLRYLDTLFPMLIESGLKLQFFFEVKANLRYEQLRKMRAAGITSVQPGIESLSSQVLRLMDKGVTALQNIQLLRWCEELGIVPLWNILAGFPGEDSDDYERMAELIPLLVHLRPPMSTAQVRLDRFSPFHTNPEHYGFRNVRPAAAYSHVFPLSSAELHRLAYYFDYDYEDGRVPGTYLEPLRDALAAWRRDRSAQRRPRLDAEMVGDEIVLIDTRPVAEVRRQTLAGVTAQVYARCDAMTTPNALLRDPELAARETEVHAALDDLIAKRLLVSDEGRYLSLAVFRRRLGAPDLTHQPRSLLLRTTDS